MTHKLSELKIKNCRYHPRGSVRRASGFVLTGHSEVVPDTLAVPILRGGEGDRPSSTAMVEPNVLNASTIIARLATNRDHPARVCAS
ncbi:MAG: hypothetical protein JO249_15115 [Acidobacteria bacterium]|nr:hypothetical protein [Acidobacteriota bacterium]